MIGSLLYAASVNIFTAPNNIAPGGLTGVATMLNYVFGLPIGTMILVMNIPLFILGFFVFGFQFVIKTVIATALSSVVIDATAGIMPQYTGQPLITVAFGGVLAGLGLGLILMRGGTSGGTELAANLLARSVSPYFHRQANHGAGRDRGARLCLGLQGVRESAVRHPRHLYHLPRDRRGALWHKPWHGQNDVYRFAQKQGDRAPSSPGWEPV